MEEISDEIISNHPEAKVALIIQEGLRRKGLSLKKLSDESGIALKHLENITSGNFEKWPAAPYLRSYLLVVGDILGFDGQALWESVREEELTVASGSTDRLPRNRFAFPQLSRNYLILTGVGVIILVIFLVRLPSILGTPSLQILFPEEPLTTSSVSPIVVQGQLENGTQVTVNGQTITLQEDGSWNTEIALESGLNTVEIIGSKFLGRETKIIRQIIFDPSTASTSTLIEEATSTEDEVEDTL
ncbi:MAG: helix-turn-helix domain-containing protein [Anaplasmataceae bacterium]|nr:helix-turn-helix domain-containing protein [Anaplasmataceae bacterium]